MVRDTAFQAVSQAQSNRATSPDWYGFMRSAILAGFEAFGSAQIGICPPSFPGGNEEPRLEGGPPSKPDVFTRNRPVAASLVGPAVIAHSACSETVSNTAWSQVSPGAIDFA